MPEPILFSLDTEEALVASLLLYDDSPALDHFNDDDVWYEHLRPVLSTIRSLHTAGKPSGTVFVLYALEPILDSLEWRGDRGEVMLLDLLSRHTQDVQAFHGVSLAKLVHHYAEKRRAVHVAQEAAQRTYTEVMESERQRFEGELR